MASLFLFQLSKESVYLSPIASSDISHISKEKCSPHHRSFAIQILMNFDVDEGLCALMEISLCEKESLTNPGFFFPIIDGNLPLSTKKEFFTNQCKSTPN